MTMLPHHRLIVPALLALSAGAALAAPPYDYPTLERVRFVQDCMAEHPGPTFEMTSKCVCVVDALAQTMTLEEFVDMNTEMKAVSIGGERGGALRDNERVQKDVRKWRAQLKQVKQACFIRDAR